MNKKMIRNLKSTMVCLICFIILLLGACSNKDIKSLLNGVMTLGGKEYPAIFVETGYYFDKASLSETVLGDQLSKVKEVKKPSSLGKMEMPSLNTIDLTKQEEINIDSSMIEAELEREVDGETTYAPIKTKRPAELKDKVIIDFTGLINGEKFDGGSMEDYPLILGSKQFIDGFEEKVVGHSAGKTFKIDLVFPENYDPSLAGKPVQFEIVIKSIEEPIAPEVNEEFVRKHSRTGATTVEQYKEEIKNRLKKQFDFLSNQFLARQLLDALFEKTKFEPTEEALAWQFSSTISKINESLEKNGMNIMTAATSNGQTMRSVYDEIKSGTANDIKETMLFDELVKRYGKELTEEDLMKWYDLIAEAGGWSNQTNYKDYIDNVGYDNFKNEIMSLEAVISATKDCNLVDGEAEN